MTLNNHQVEDNKTTTVVDNAIIITVTMDEEVVVVVPIPPAPPVGADVVVPLVSSLSQPLQASNATRAALAPRK